MDTLLADGWYLMNGISSDYRINEQGKILNVVRGRIHPVHYNLTSAIRRSYHTTLKDEYGFPVDKPVHRLVALTFLKLPERLAGVPVEQLQVFHTDGNKNNNDVHNLEWVTQTEYTQRIRAVEGYSTGTHVIARHTDSEEVLWFPSISSAAKHADIPQASMNKHVESEAAGRIQKAGWVYKLLNDIPWPEIVFPESEHLRLTRVADIVVTHDGHTKLYIFNSIVEATRLLNLSLIGVRNHFNRQGFDVPFEGYRFYTIENYFRNK
jgi:HNH endonuclease